ncbi:hypothetical protein T07_14190 [Trichinella nelsoni]|uniref:Uncharacterized protein n=1 Tax=Trichinella nelsoni TaxID=6336 RepID=A0A0V0RCQ7_9BILA|nr:hypothetical protein T07_14190 [Trichinella nelsoni]
MVDVEVVRIQAKWMYSDIIGSYGSHFKDEGNNFRPF